MSVEIEGKTFELNNTAAIVRHYRKVPKPAHPVFLMGCERCKTSCSLAPDASCECCTWYKKRTAGGTLIYPNINAQPTGLFGHDPKAPCHVRLGRFKDLIKL